MCPFCSCGSEPHVLCKSCQPQVRGAQPTFSFRLLLWRFKMLPFGCHGEKWLFLVRKRQSFVVPTDLTGDEYQWLVHQLPRQRREQVAHLEQKRTLDRVGSAPATKREIELFGITSAGGRCCSVGCGSHVSAAADSGCQLQAVELPGQTTVFVV